MIGEIEKKNYFIENYEKSIISEIIFLFFCTKLNSNAIEELRKPICFYGFVFTLSI